MRKSTKVDENVIHHKAQKMSEYRLFPNFNFFRIQSE